MGKTYRIVCQMSDGSVWTCDEFMGDWKKEMPSLDSLNKSFEAFEKFSKQYS